MGSCYQIQVSNAGNSTEDGYAGEDAVEESEKGKSQRYAIYLSSSLFGSQFCGPLKSMVLHS